MNFVRSIIVPQTMARETAQKTNTKKNFAAGGAVLPVSVGRSMVKPGWKLGANPLPPISQKAPAPGPGRGRQSVQSRGVLSCAHGRVGQQAPSMCGMNEKVGGSLGQAARDPSGSD